MTPPAAAPITHPHCPSAPAINGRRPIPDERAPGAPSPALFTVRGTHGLGPVFTARALCAIAPAAARE